jgi:DNA polymerase-3 subunit epsilon
VSEQSRQLDDRLLSELVYTVFDTETTGLNPSQGDEIIQIGAVRVVNQRLLVQESMDQLIDPKRNIPAHTIPIHGITPELDFIHFKERSMRIASGARRGCGGY